MVLFVVDSNGIILIGNSGIEIFYFAVFVSRVVGSHVLVFDYINLDLLRKTFL